MDVLLSSWGSLASGVMEVGLSLWVSLTAQVMKVGLSSRVDLSSNIKRGWESGTNGGDGMSVTSSVSVSTSNSWCSNGWGSNGRASSIANGAEGAATASSKVVSLGGSDSGLVIGGDSAIGVNPQAKGSSSKSLGTSIASIAVSSGV